MTSLVERVIRLAVENLPISSIENPWTLLKSFALNTAEKSEAILEEIIATTTVAARLPNAQSSIFPPAAIISAILLPSVWTSDVMSAI